MFPADFDYHRPETVRDATELLSELQDQDTALLAGGHSLIPLMKQRLASPDVLVDISRIDELKGISRNGDTISIGPLSTHFDLSQSDVLKEHATALSEAAAAVGDVQVRNRGTIGGNLAHGDPSSDPPAAFLALGGSVVTRTDSGERTIPADDFLQDMFMTDLGNTEIITRLKVPVPSEDRVSDYSKLPNPSSGHAIVGVAAALEVSDGTIQSASVAANGATGRAESLTEVEDALSGKPFQESVIEEASKHGCETVDEEEVLSDTHTSAEYRMNLLNVHTERVLKKLLDRR